MSKTNLAAIFSLWKLLSKCFLPLMSPPYVHSPLPDKHDCPRGQRMTTCGKKAVQSWWFSSSILTVQGVKVGKIPVLLWGVGLRGCSNQSHSSNSTDWAQGCVCFKPLTYFYRSCSEQSLTGRTFEPMLLMCSKTKRKYLENKKRRAL